MEEIEQEPRFIEEGSAKIYEQGHVFYNPVQEVKYGRVYVITWCPP